MVEKIKSVWGKIIDGEQLFVFCMGTLVVCLASLFVTWIATAVFKFMFTGEPCG